MISSFGLSEEDKSKFNVVVERFEAHFVKKRCGKSGHVGKQQCPARDVTGEVISRVYAGPDQ